MALSQSTLAANLENLVPTVNAAEAVQELADAYGGYMQAATAGALPILTVAAPTAAMAGAMSFPVPGTTAGAGAAVQSGVAAFWSAMAAAPATYFAGATILVPPAAIAALGAALASVFASNVGLSLEDSAAAMAAAMHTASLGGTITVGVPPPIPIT